MKKIIYIVSFVFIASVILNACSEDGLAETGTGILEGRVVADGSNEPLVNAKITTNPVSTTVFTDATGDFDFGDIPVGEYSVQAEIDGYIAGFKAANVLDGRTVNVVFELEETSSTNISPLTPTLVFPEDNAAEINTELEFVWNSSANDTDTVLYTFELRDGSSNEILMAESLEDTTYSVSGLSLGTNYFWQVTATDNVNEPVESSINGFTTLSLVQKRFFFVKKEGNNNVIYAGDDVNSDGVPDQGIIQITSPDANSFRPRKDPGSERVAFLRTVGTESHLFTIELNGLEETQLTDQVPVVGFRQDEVDFTWFNNGGQLYYTNLNRLYSINADGSGRVFEYEAPADVFITEVVVNGANDLVAIKTNDAEGYNARIVILDPNTGTEVDVVIENVSGALGGLDFSVDGTRVLYTRDVSGFESAYYRQLDTRIFEYNLMTQTTTEFDTDKVNGTNDLDPRYSPNEGAIIFMNTSNDGISQRNIYKHQIGATISRELLFSDASMPDWE